MTDTLDNGIKLPAKGSRDWYSDASSNAHLIDEHLGDEDVHLSDDDRTAISSISSKADASDVYTKTQVDTSLNSKANASDLTTHTSNSDIHVTSTDKATWNAKQGALSTAQLNACNSGITSTKVSGYDTHVANSDVHVTTSDKSTWNAKQGALSTTQLSACNSGITSDKVSQYDGYATSKANDSSVVHTSGDETIGGTKTFSDGIISNVTGKGALTLQSKNGTSRIYIRNNDATSYPSSVNLYSKVGNNAEQGVFLNDVNFHPLNNGVMNLGHVNRKWKTFNGINPGALSLPNFNALDYKTVDTTNWVTTKTTKGNDFYPLIDGWYMIRTVTGSVSIVVNNLQIGQNTANYGVILVPVKKDVRVTVYIDNLSSGNVMVSTIYPCQGNV